MDDLEPMDVDRSGSTTSKMDISYLESDYSDYEDFGLSSEANLRRVTRTSPSISPRSRISPRIRSRSSFFDSTTTEYQEGSTPTKNESPDLGPSPRNRINKYHIQMQRVHKNQSKSSSHKVILIGISITLTLGFIFFYQMTKLNCVDEIDIRTVRKSFTEHLYGQNDAANQIIEMLNMKVRSKILFLYGGTGVGKTYAVSLMLESIWNSANIYHYTMPSFADSFSPELMFGLTLCKSSVVIVDGLNRNDFQIKSQIKSVISKSDNLGKNITVILIYNCDNISDNFVKKCDTNFKSDLQQQFSDVDSEKEYIKFITLTEEHLKKCIEKELGDRKVNRDEMDNIMKNFDVSFDGCKGVYNKVKLFNIV